MFFFFFLACVELNLVSAMAGISRSFSQERDQPLTKHSVGYDTFTGFLSCGIAGKMKVLDRLIIESLHPA